MGFLDHSTNNIIVDAVLTDQGRQALARNDGSFSISKFALGDDEVDYTIIQQYGRTVGKEKIEKNTPILEALTAGSLGMKYKNVSIDNPYLTHLPVIDITNPLGSTPINMRRPNTAGTNPINQTVRGEILKKNNDGTASNTAIDASILDARIQVEVDNRFLYVQNTQPDFAYTDNTAVYRLITTSQSNGKLEFSVTLNVKSFSQSVFNAYSIATTGTYIRTFVTLRGLTSGITKNLEIRIY